MTVWRLLRQVSFRWHCLLARSETATRFYLYGLAAAARLQPSRRLRDLAEWSVFGQRVPWKPLAFGPRAVMMGCSTRVKLIPHLGEGEQAAMFRDQIRNEVVEFLEVHASTRYDAVIDIGANIGWIALSLDSLIRARPNGKLRDVFAFEPSPKVFARLLANMDANGATSITPFCAAISSAVGFEAFYQPEGRLSNGSLSQDFSRLFTVPSSKTTVVTLAADTLEAFFTSRSSVLVKIDVEGYEPQVLAALGAIIERHRPDLVIEVLKGVDTQVLALGCLEGYASFRILEGGCLERAPLAFDPGHRDWLLTVEPGRFEAPK